MKDIKMMIYRSLNLFCSKTGFNTICRVLPLFVLLFAISAVKIQAQITITVNSARDLPFDQLAVGEKTLRKALDEVGNSPNSHVEIEFDIDPNFIPGLPHDAPFHIVLREPLELKNLFSDEGSLQIGSPFENTGDKVVLFSSLKGENDPNLTHGLLIENCGPVSVFNVGFDGFAEHGLKYVNSSSPNLRYCHFANMKKAGVYIDNFKLDNAATIVRDCFFENTGEYGLHINYAQHTDVQANVFKDQTIAPIKYGYGSANYFQPPGTNEFHVTHNSVSGRIFAEENRKYNVHVYACNANGTNIGSTPIETAIIPQFNYGYQDWNVAISDVYPGYVTIQYEVLFLENGNVVDAATTAFSKPKAIPINNSPCESGGIPIVVTEPTEAALRAAINSANANTDYNTIEFNIPNEGNPLPIEFHLNQNLPPITTKVCMDGNTQIEGNPVLGPKIKINCHDNSGINLDAGSDGSVVANLEIDNAFSTGIVVVSNNNRILNNVITNVVASAFFGSYGIGYYGDGSIIIRGNRIGTDFSGSPIGSQINVGIELKSYEVTASAVIGASIESGKTTRNNFYEPNIIKNVNTGVVVNQSFNNGQILSNIIDANYDAILFINTSNTNVHPPNVDEIIHRNLPGKNPGIYGSGVQQNDFVQVYIRDNTNPTSSTTAFLLGETKVTSVDGTWVLPKEKWRVMDITDRSYSVFATVTRGNGGTLSDFQSKTSEFSSSLPVCTPTDIIPDMDFIYNECLGADGHFNHLGAVRTDYYFWNYGDGMGEWYVNGSCASPKCAHNPLHDYDEGGLYDVSLIGYSKEGCAFPNTKQVEVMGGNASIAYSACNVGGQGELRLWIEPLANEEFYYYWEISGQSSNFNDQTEVVISVNPLETVSVSVTIFIGECQITLAKEITIPEVLPNVPVIDIYQLKFVQE